LSHAVDLIFAAEEQVSAAALLDRTSLFSGRGRTILPAILIER
jgi:hypothetical protein